jgi:uncharacterized protein YlxW (UPF0749 family)
MRRRAPLALRSDLEIQMWNIKQLSMLAAALLLGMLVSLQWPTATAQVPGPSDRISQTVRQLELEQQELKRTIGHLREELNQRHQDAPERIQELRKELTLQKMRAGLIDVRGSGIRVDLDDGPRADSGGDRDSALVHDYDLRDVINVLWMAGAEAVAVNDERIVHSTSIYCVGSTIMVNNTRLSPPYHISAIGDPVQLQETLRNPGYLKDLRTRIERFGVGIELVPSESITILAYRGSFPQRFAQPGSEDQP